MTEALGRLWSMPRTNAVFLDRAVQDHPGGADHAKGRCRGASHHRRNKYGLARRLIEEHSDKMHAMAKALLEWETIDGDQLDDIMAGKREPRPPKGLDAARTPSLRRWISGGTPPSPDPRTHGCLTGRRNTASVMEGLLPRCRLPSRFEQSGTMIWQPVLRN